MLELTLEGIQNRKEWQEKGYELPQFDIAKMRQETLEAPEWIHYGAGNIFKAFLASSWQQVLNEEKAEKGIIAVAPTPRSFGVIKALTEPHDELTLAVTLNADGTIRKRVVASIAKTLAFDHDDEEVWAEFSRIFTSRSLKMVSFTISEKGYVLTDAFGNDLPAVEADFYNGPETASTFIGKLCALLYDRFKAGAYPIALQSMDNCAHNGTRLFEAVSTYAARWVSNGLVDKDFGSYIINPTKVAFPWSMIDKITPRPDAGVRKMLDADGLDLGQAADGKSPYDVFVNAEAPQYLVMEDHDPNGRPFLEAMDGVIFTDRETVDKTEKMKVCTCLNPLHTCLAVYGCLLGYTKIADEMKDPELVPMIRRIGRTEGMPVVVNPGILDPEKFLNEVLTKRFPNPFMPDTPQRIAMDTSQKLPIRYGETIKPILPRRIKTLRI